MLGGWLTISLRLLGFVPVLRTQEECLFYWRPVSQQRVWVSDGPFSECGKGRALTAELQSRLRHPPNTPQLIEPVLNPTTLYLSVRS